MLLGISALTSNTLYNLLYVKFILVKLSNTDSGPGGRSSGKWLCEKSVASNLMTQDHKAISPKGGLPVSHATLDLCVRDICVCVSVHVPDMCESVGLREVHLYVRLKCCVCLTVAGCRETCISAVCTCASTLQYVHMYINSKGGQKAGPQHLSLVLIQD